MNVALGSPVRKIRTPGSAGGGRRKEQSAQGRPLPTTRTGDTQRSDICLPRSSSDSGDSGSKSTKNAFGRKCSVQQRARMPYNRFNDTRKASRYPPQNDDAGGGARGREEQEL